MFACVLIFHFQPLVEDMICAPIVRIERMLKQFKANLPPPEYLFCVTAERKNCDIYGNILHN
jgi:hypothetical protein